MPKFIKNNWLLLLILLGGLVLRIYKPLELFQYSHDQDLLGWFVRDVLVNHHIRLIGQETSSHGVFIGPYFYYLQIPFYLASRYDPSGALVLPILLGVFAVWSCYFVFEKIFNKQTALIGATIYAFSTLIVFTDREVDPTMPVMLWTVWYLFALSRVLKEEKYGYLITGLLVGLIWNLNLALVILVPLIILAQIFSKKKINLKELFVGLIIAISLNIPFLVFEVRHGFQQSKAVLSSLTTSKDYVSGTVTGFVKLDRVMQLVYKNTRNLYWTNLFNVPVHLTFWILVGVFIFLIYKKKLSKQMGVILFLWQALYILFFATNSINTSEYYLNGMNVVWILVAAVGIGEILQNKKLRILGLLILGLFVLVNLYAFFTKPIDRSGYIERKGIIEYIKEDSRAHGYPCVSLSFITTPGRDLGYRYFTWELGLKTKKISDKVPVYSIVFPLSSVSGFDKSFGALGLVLPDYKRYNDKVVENSCQGDDYTVTQPMFGFTN